MGRANSGPRKGKKKHPQHLAKVGTSTENERLQHAERRAVMANFGLGNASSTTRAVVFVIFGLIFARAVWALLALTVLRWLLPDELRHDRREVLEEVASDDDVRDAPLL